MLNEPPRATLRIAGRPLHALLVPVPLVCFGLTLVFDLVYLQTAAMQWANMSAWLLTIGLVVALFAVIAGLIDFLGSSAIRSIGAVWLHAVGNGVALALAILDALIHTRDAYTSVAPWGALLSALVVAIMACTAWLGFGLVHRRGVGVEGRA